MTPLVVTRSGGLALGDLDLSDGLFELTLSEYEEQETGFAALGFDLDREGNHNIDGSWLWREKSQEVVELRENGYLPGFDYAEATRLQLSAALPEGEGAPLFADGTTLSSFMRNSIQNREASDFPISRGALAWGSFLDSTSFQRDRTLRVFQLNGDHTFDALPGSTSAGRSTGRHQPGRGRPGNEVLLRAVRLQRTVPCPAGTPRIDPTSISTFPRSIEELGPGSFVANNRIRVSANSIDETSTFYRLDLDYEIVLSPLLASP